MEINGKGFFIWKVRDCENGDSQAIANQASQSGLTHLLVKIADGTYSYNVDPSGVDQVLPIVQACHARGMLVLGWQYIYGEDPVGEANKAIQRIHQTRVDGFVIDVEKEFKEPGKDQAALKYMERLRAAFPSMTLALSSYRFPSYHPQIPWDIFLERCDYNMPQVYWVLAHNPAEQLDRCVREFQSMVPFRPIIPTGSAYKSGGWQATPEEVTALMDKARQLNLTATNFWEWANCRTYLPDVWRAIASYPWPTGEMQKDIVQQYMDALNARDVAQIASLYNDNAVHINAARTVQGLPAIRSWYQSLLTQILPNATFSLGGYTGIGNSRHLNWTATSPSGKVKNGRDTFGLLDGKIGYHYTFFDVVK